MKDFNFPAKNQNFDLKLNIQNFEKKKIENSEFVDFWGHFKLKMFCQNRDFFFQKVLTLEFELIIFAIICSH